ncbi:MAG TPA: cytochrome d ubiquinol oxidase subunit II [Aeromicrobium sp.]|nr:cytochrome d ubiquinol oxidase subunit II [Aeromicrobium sp.]
MELTTIWFVLIAVLWTGYLVLEGFDFGVGMLMGLLAQDDRERRVLLNTIGPVWDANEVWLLVAGGATFAAFPEWYATLFSGFYLPLLLILLALIVRVVGIEFRSKRPDPQWRRWCDLAIITGSFVPALLWGVALANIVRGVPIDASSEYVGSLWDLLNPYALLGGLVTVSVFVVHGAFFVALKTTGPIHGRAMSFGRRSAALAGGFATAFVVWTVGRDVGVATVVLGVVVLASFVAALANALGERDGWAFAGTTVTIGALVVLLFTALFPDVMPSSLDAAWSLTTTNAAATPYTLKIMSWVAVVFTPLVLLYQGWSYWVFRRRIGVHHIPA